MSVVQPDPPSEFCKWTRQDDNIYHWRTACEKEFVLVDSTPANSGILFCPYCGAPVELPYEEDD